MSAACGSPPISRPCSVQPTLSRAEPKLVHKPRKRFGQHFLHDQNVIRRTVDVLAPVPGETVIEIGPGQGVLTAQLLEAGARVVAVEVDRDLVASLRERFHGQAFEVTNADVLKTDIGALMEAGAPLRLVGNLPYNISTPLMFHFLEWVERTRDMHFMVQKEVAERMAAGPGSKAYGRLSVMLGARLTVMRLFDVGPGAFSPPPKVDSSVVRLVPRTGEPIVGKNIEQTFAQLVRQCFSQRRKTLRKSLSAWLSPADFDGLSMAATARPEELTIAQFAELACAADAKK